MSSARACLIAAAVLGWLTTTPVPPAAGADETGARSFLWQVRSGPRTVYLLGSIHFMKPGSEAIGPAIEAAFDACDVVVFEADLDELTAAAVTMLSAGTYDDGRTLEDAVPAATYREVVDRFESAGMTAAAARSMRPWMAALSLTSLELAGSGYLGEEGIDATLNARAKAAGKERRGLETAEFQISLFAGLSEAQGVEFLEYTLHELDTVIPLVDEVVASWRAGDAKRLEALLGDGFDGHRDLYRAFVTDRNRRWLPQIEALLGGGADALVVVGSLHLVGDDGLIALLEGEGYEVTQL